MATTNFVYPTYKNNLLLGAANVSLNGTVGTAPWVTLLENTYTYSAAHTVYADISAHLSGATDTAMVSAGVGPAVSLPNGTFDADDVTFSAVAAGTEIANLIIYRATTGTGTGQLVLVERGDDDTAPVTGLPVVPNGGDISISFSASGILLI